MLTKRVHEFLKKRTFLNVATATLDGKPNNVSKLILKAEEHFVYLVDYAIGRTYTNVKVNPRVSLSFFDLEKLVGFQINGPVELIEKGPVYDSFKAELTEKEISLATERIIKGVSNGQGHEKFELAPPRHFVIFKIKIEEIAEVSYSGEIKREKS
ncbi:MAG TPA: pyridoxamine 5'-phosphate oxidase family protein [Candidatus Omnitrophota bacterium]|nr:pyridoxamine 5'-phosphate oxidase family protein [Candidatus Omnitrophota bacterium]HQO38665.1 pyridoxamine 5'-phosphate oxidase family protein [Candidatus Omnitrophota bacterium]HQQ06029.1 pyridoxamine 5'-phosphate oxidase family protein [Candidatus Omnitrophota bacterium]